MWFSRCQYQEIISGSVIFLVVLMKADESYMIEDLR